MQCPNCGDKSLSLFESCVHFHVYDFSVTGDNLFKTEPRPDLETKQDEKGRLGEDDPYFESEYIGCRSCRADWSVDEFREIVGKAPIGSGQG